MKVLKFATFLSAVVLSFGAFLSPVLAQSNATTPSEAGLQKIPAVDLNIQAEQETGVDCFDYYEFGSISTKINSEMVEYAPGTTIKLKGEVKNENPYPIVNGYLYARILRENTGDVGLSGDHVIDEFLVAENIYLDKGETQKIKDFEWLLPKNSIPGKYKVATFFVVDKKFNLSGLTFYNHLYAGFSSFTVTGKGSAGVFFNRDRTKVNGKAFKLRDFNESYKVGSPLTVAVPLKNTSGKSQKVAVNYQLFYWDGLQSKNILDNKSEEVTLAPFSEKEVTYTVNDPKETVYFLVIRAEGDGIKSYVSIRPVRDDGIRGRINFSGITKFPVSSGDSLTSFTCFHNTSGGEFKGKVESVLKDKKGNVVNTVVYEGDVFSSIMAQKSDLVAAENYDYLELETTLRDESGAVVDQSKLIYDCGLFSGDLCRKPVIAVIDGSFGGKNINILVVSIVVVMLGLMVFLYRRTGKKIFVFLLLPLVVIGLFFAYKAYVAKSYTVSSTKVVSFDHDSGKFTRHSATVNHDLNLIQNGAYMASGQNITGSPITYTYAKDGEWVWTGGDWDTPIIHWNTNGNYNGDQCQHKVSSGGSTNFFYDVSCTAPANGVAAVSGPVSCVGNTCTPTGYGTIQIKTWVNRTVCQWAFYAKNISTGVCSPQFSRDYEQDTYQEVVYTFNYPAPVVNGACATPPNGGSYSSCPSAGLCSSGTATALNQSGNQCQWSCNGSGGGANAPCAATVVSPLSFRCDPVAGIAADISIPSSLNRCPGKSYTITIDNDDISSNGYWTKSNSTGTTLTTAPGGFLGVGAKVGIPLVFTPSQTYRVRFYYLYNDSICQFNGRYDPVSGTHSAVAPNNCAPACTPISSEGFVSGTVSPSNVSPGGDYTIKCDYGNNGVDSIDAVPGSGACVWAGTSNPALGWDGDAAVFNCQAGTTASSFSNSCKVNLGTSSNNCARTDAIQGGLLEVVSPQDDAEVVSSCSIDGDVVAGQPFTAYLFMKNNGGTNWVRPAFVLSTTTSALNLWGAGSPFNIPLSDSPVEPGETQRFTLNLTAPSAPGNYPFGWRMFNSNGLGSWFGEVNTGNGCVDSVTEQIEVRPIGFALVAAGELVANLDADLTGTRNSSGIKVTVVQDEGYDGGAVNLSVVSVLPSWPTGSYGLFTSPSLSTEQFLSGTQFSMRDILNSTSPGTRRVTIRGVSSSNGAEDTVEVNLRILNSNYENQ